VSYSETGVRVDFSIKGLAQIPPCSSAGFGPATPAPSERGRPRPDARTRCMRFSICQRNRSLAPMRCCWVCSLSDSALHDMLRYDSDVEPRWACHCSPPKAAIVRLGIEERCLRGLRADVEKTRDEPPRMNPTPFPDSQNRYDRARTLRSTTTQSEGAWSR
jgi:hypothetical protein